MKSWFYTKITNGSDRFLNTLAEGLDDFQMAGDQVYVFSSSKENYNEMSATNDFRKVVAEFFGPARENPQMGVRWLSPLQVGRDQSNWAPEGVLEAQRIAEEFLRSNNG